MAAEQATFDTIMQVTSDLGYQLVTIVDKLSQLGTEPNSTFYMFVQFHLRTTTTSNTACVCKSISNWSREWALQLLALIRIWRVISHIDVSYAVDSA